MWNIWNFSVCGVISDFSTSVTHWNLKFLHKTNFSPSISKHLKGCFGPRVSDVFWIKRILLFSLFLDTFSCSKDFAVSLFPDTFRVQRILLFPCFQTLSVFKGFWRFPVSRHFNFSKVSGNRKNNQIHWENHYCQGILSFLLFIDTFWIQKCQVTEKQPNPLKRS